MKRYDLDPEGRCDGESGSCKAHMEVRANGDWVSYDDYAELEKLYNDLKRRATEAINLLES